MKIAVIYDAIYPWVKGGAEKRIYEISNRLVKNGHEVHWYGVGWWLGNDNNDKIVINDGIICHAVCKPFNLYKNGKRTSIGPLIFSINLFKYLLRSDYDIIDCYSFPYFPNFSAKICSLLTQKKFCITWIEVWDDYWYEYYGQMGVFGKIIEKISIYLTKNKIAISQKTKNDLIKIGGSNEIKVIPPGIDFKEIQSINKLNLELDLIFVGRLIKEKNVDILIKSIKIIKNEIPLIKCLIIGDGPEKNNLIKLSKDLNLSTNIKFLGFLNSYEKLIGHIKSSKVFILPSTREGFGIVVLEANACGLPVIVIKSDMNASVDLIKEHYNGMISSFCEKDLALKTIECLKNKQIMENKCIEFSKKYDWEKIVNSLENYYLQV